MLTPARCALACVGSAPPNPHPAPPRPQFRRGAVLARRTKLFIIVRTFQLTLMSFVVATLFVQTPKDTVADGERARDLLLPAGMRCVPCMGAAAAQPAPPVFERPRAGCPGREPACSAQACSETLQLCTTHRPRPCHHLPSPCWCLLRAGNLFLSVQFFSAIYMLFGGIAE